MRTRYLVQSGSVSSQQPSTSRVPEMKVFLRGNVLARLVLIYSTKVEQLTIAVESSAYKVPAGVLCRSIVTEHLQG